MAFATAHSTMPDEAEMEVVFRPAGAAGGLACWLALPGRMAVDQAPLVAVHGIRRNARQQAELLARRASALGRPVIAPLFDRETWPRYQQAVRRGRADLALIALMKALKKEGVRQTTRFELAGFSGGAQFAHRFAMMHPEMVTRLTVASAGWYTFPDAARFPYGLSCRNAPPDPWSAVTDDTIGRFLTIPVQVCVGADDTLRDAGLRSGETIDAQQGANRLIRGIRWTKALRQATQARGLPPRASFIALSACGHDFRQCVLRGGLDRIIFPDNDRKSPVIGGCGRDCSACDRPCKAGMRLLRPMP
ncbi:MAG: hypothetical protein JJ920_07680 [Roseitalea sp.]|jgi:pimeloyl-ACP methyl ester carboxylesterase|nr:hypothetical protein [Roseitalea sp.]MBO6720416.1 hypothetical protein [Roseitalea sp.]MBO6742776.1 hypothetical protein [Roseitalea sp.]